MRLKYGFFADYAGLAAAGKMMVIGIFDTVFDQMQARPIPLPPSYLVLAFEANAAEGSDHRFRIEVTTEDGAVVHNAAGLPIWPQRELGVRFSPQGVGRPLLAHMTVKLDGLALPDLGEYTFHIYIDNTHVDQVLLVVNPPPATS